MAGTTKAAQAFKVLGNEARLNVFLMIAEHSPVRREGEPEEYWSHEGRERSCSLAMAMKLGLSQPTVSRHLKEIERASLIKIRRKGTCVSCRINDNTVRDLVALLLEWGARNGTN